jgi:hypothetical protein
MFSFSLIYTSKGYKNIFNFILVGVDFSKKNVYICTIIKKDMRYRLESNGEVLGVFKSIEAIGEHVGCTKQHIYVTLPSGGFKFKKKKYKIIDRLSELS